jgi:RNA polymerase sigma factor (sigma-70 family)
LEPTLAADPKLLERYEGLVIKTSSMYVGIIRQMEFEDICQILRVKVWRSLEKFEPGRYPLDRRQLAMDSFIFGCVRNQVKDLLKRNKTQDLYIDDLAPSDGGRVGSGGPDGATRDRFEFRYLQADRDQVFQGAEESDPLIPNTLNDNERLVLVCLYRGYNGPETAERLGIGRRQVAAILRTLREKMGDWKPNDGTEEDELSPAPLGDDPAAVRAV